MAIAAGNGANANGGTSPIYFDTLGRFYRLGVRASFQVAPSIDTTY